MCTYNFFQHIITAYFTLELPLFFLADESTDEEVSRPQTKEEEDIDMLCSWLQVGGFLLIQRRRHGGFCCRWVYPLVSLFTNSHGFLLPFILLPLYPILSFRGWVCWKRLVLSWRRPTDWRQRPSAWRQRDWKKMEAAVAGSEVEGFYGLLRGAMLHSSISPAPPPHKKICHTPSATISHLLPQESTAPEVPKPEVCLSSCPSSFRGGNPCPYATHSYSAGGIKWVYRCQVEGCKEGTSTLHATICMHVCKLHLGVGLVCPSCSKSFFNPDTFQYHKKSHTNL